MALGLALTGLKNKADGKELWTLKTVSWWNELELTKDRRFQQLDLGPDKLVYEAILAVDQTWELHRKYKKKFLEVFEEDPLEKTYREERLNQVVELESKLQDPILGFVKIWVFDWDY